MHDHVVARNMSERTQKRWNGGKAAWNDAKDTGPST